MSGSSRRYLIFLLISFISFPLPVIAGGKKAPVVGIDNVSVISHSETLKAIGTLVAREQITVTSRVEGFIDQLDIQDGEQVKAGQRLIALDHRFEQAKLNEASAKLNEDSRRLKELQDLVAKRAASTSELDVQKSLVTQSRAILKAAETTLDYYFIRAPFSGVLGMNQLSKGQFIRVGDPLVSLINLDKLYVDFNLPSRYLNSIKSGQLLSLTFEAWPGKTFKAQVSVIDPLINVDSRNLKVRANVDNSDHRLFPGLLADVTLTLPAKESVSVKTTSVFYKGGQAYVYRVGPDNTTILCPVVTGSSSATETLIVSGLNPNDRVVSRGVIKVSEGIKVLPDTRSASRNDNQNSSERSL